jgi:hypothetical protein
MTIMTASVWTDEWDLSSASDRALDLAARFWFLVVVAGQWIFAVYVVAFYGGSAVRGDLDAWNRVLPRGHVPGDTIGNLVVAIHLALAVIIIVGGPLQLIPKIRRYAPSFHRWNGRLYTLTLFATSIAGLYMIWSRGQAGVARQFGTTLHAVLIMSFAVLAVRHAVARDITTHRRWALRLFMVVNAGSFFRIGLMRWIFVNDSARSNASFINVFSLTDYLLPLVILELYLRIRDRGGVGSRFAMAAGVSVLTVLMGVGIFMRQLSK